MEKSNIKIERRFDDSMSSLSSSKHKVQEHKTKSKHAIGFNSRQTFYETIEYFNTLFNSLHTCIFTLLLLYKQSILSWYTLNLMMMTWSHRNVVLFLYRFSPLNFGSVQKICLFSIASYSLIYLHIITCFARVSAYWAPMDGAEDKIQETPWMKLSFKETAALKDS